MKRLLPFLTLLFLVSFVRAESYKDWSTTNVSQDDGDTISTTQATTSCTTGCTGGASLLSAAITNRGNRRRTICNTSAWAVFIGTATVANSLTSTGFRISESTGTASCFQTYSTAAFYGQSVGPSSATVSIIQEKQAVP